MVLPLYYQIYLLAIIGNMLPIDSPKVLVLLCRQ